MGCELPRAGKTNFKKVPTRGESDLSPFQCSDNFRVHSCPTAFGNFASELNKVRFHHQKALVNDSGEMITICTTGHGLF